MAKELYKTKYGKYFIGDSEQLLSGSMGFNIENKVQLILTSPPFPLNKKKKYGNLQGEEYKKWLANLSVVFSKMLTADGSLVIEMGNSWEPGRPVQSLLHLEALMGLVNNPKSNFRLIQQFVCYNPSRIPSPAQWVTINRIRTTDSFTHIWWLAKSDYPKADNSKVLRPYSDSMKKLLKRKSFNHGRRPSEHKISEYGFLKNNKGSIMQNVLEIEPMDENRSVRLPELNNAFSVSNTNSNEYFLQQCREKGITPHPARMPLEIASFFVKYLTDEQDLVLDPFAGSNTTGFISETLKRKWVSIETNLEYGHQSKLRFNNPVLKK